jgi:outer membrane autotransporter protein
VRLKTKPLKVTTHPVMKLPSILATSIHAFLVALSLLVATSTPVFAVDAVWLLNPETNNWNSGFNWSTSPSAPINPADTATFNTSTQNSLTLSGVTVESITFNPQASAFTIATNLSTNGNGGLTVQGAGIVNNSGKTQTIYNDSSLPRAGVLGGATDFRNASTAGNVTIDNANLTGFFNTSTAGNATISNFRLLEFFNTSTAGNATITNIGNSRPDTRQFPNPASLTAFFNTSTAGSATINNDGGTGGGLGGQTRFFDSSDGGTARTVTNGNGSFDISGLTTVGMKIGSIEGSGNYFLGSKALTVGGNNLSTTVSGVIQDGGVNGGGGGSLTKICTGTLTLTGTNTYSGGTNLNGGILAINSDVNLGTGPLSFNSGTLEALATGGGIISSKAITLNAGGGTFLADGGTNSTLSGMISGTGNVVRLGTGTLTLTGANIYTGGTSISAGTLQLGNGGTAGSITGNVVDNGTLAFNRSDSVTFGGVISGAGNVSQVGTGTLILTGANIYTGGTSISAGTLQLGNGGTAGSITGNVVDNGTLAFNRSDSATFDGVISGAGNVSQVGTGTLILTGANTYTGGTSISAGTLQAGSATALSPNSAFAVTSILDLNGFNNTIGSLSGTGTVLNNGATTATLTVGNENTNTTYGGVLENGSSVLQLTKSGPGTLRLTGGNTYTGTTTVNAGSLIVDGSIASTQTLVNASGLLGGHGSLGGSLVNSGTVSPGDSPGTLTVNGNYTQNAGGTLRIEVAGLAASQHDLLVVNGHASLASTLQLIGLSGFKLHVGDQVTFLTANGGVSGTFGTVQNQVSTGTLVKAEVVDLPNAVVLEGVQGSFVPTACTPNTVAVAQALDSAVGDPRASTLIEFLDAQPLNQLCGDFSLISPEALASIFNFAVSLANVQTANLKRRMEDIPAGSTGFSAAGFTLNGITPNLSSGLAGVSGPEGKSGPSVMTPTAENRWGVWVTGIGEFTNVDSTDNAAGYYLQTGGVTLGVDYRVCSNFAIGFTTGYAHTDASLANGGDIEVNGGTFGLYATAFSSGFYLDTAVTGGPNGYNTRRTALLGSANGNTDGGDLNVLVAGGYDWKKGGLTIGPTANFQFTYVGFSGFTESGSLAPLKFPGQNAESERTAFGMKASYDWKVSRVIIKPEISLAWQHEYGDEAYSIISSFASGAGNSFTVSSPNLGRDSLLIGAGAAVLLSERISVYAYYDGELLRTNYQSNNVSAGVRVTF